MDRTGRTDLDDLLAELESVSGPAPQPPAPAAPEPPPAAAAVPQPPAPAPDAPSAPPPPAGDAGGFFSPASTPAGAETVPPPEAPPGRPGRFVAPEPVKVTRAGKGTGLGGIAVFLGVVCLLLSWFMPQFWFLIGLTLFGAGVMGGMTFRHAVNYDTPGRTTGGIALILATLSLAAFVVSLNTRADEIQEVTSGGGLFGAMDAMEIEGEVLGMTLPGTGTASIALDGQTFELPLESCGFAEPSVGVDQAGRGASDSSGRALSIAFLSSTIGDREDAITIGVGVTGYVLTGTNLFEVDGGTLTVTGELREAFGSSKVQATVTATCNA